MTAVPLTPRAIDYHSWRTRSVTVAGTPYTVATKPGMTGQGRDDATALLAERMMIPLGATVVSFQCGNGLLGAVAAIGRGAAHVYLSDRSVLAVEATRRTMNANGISNCTIRSGHGSAPFDESLRADVVTIRIPTEKLSLWQLLADAFAVLRVGGQCCIAGATNEGIKSAATQLTALFGNATVLGTEGGCRAVMAIKRAPKPVDATVMASAYLQHDAFLPIDVTLRGHPLQLFSRPGVFSWEHLDEATAILADVMQVAPGDDVLDLGCGSGPLGITAARLSGTGRINLVDIDSEAVRCAERAVAMAGLTNCEVNASDAAATVRDLRFDVVVTNPPFHVGKATDLDVPTQFILDAHAVLKPGGSLQLVANRTLPYERLVHQCFGNLTTLHDGPRFKVLFAQR
jgi:16S rRNA (guanine1207-N2)-methyltransferase